MTVAVEDHVLKLDVREIPRVERHPRIFGMLNSLLPDYQLILTVDHDPVPLYYHLETHYDGMFGWEYLPGVRRYGKSAFAGRNTKAATATAVAVIKKSGSDRSTAVAPMHIRRDRTGEV